MIGVTANSRELESTHRTVRDKIEDRLCKRDNIQTHNSSQLVNTISSNIVKNLNYHNNVKDSE